MTPHDDPKSTVLGEKELIRELEPTREEMIAALDPEQRDTIITAYNDVCNDLGQEPVNEMSDLPARVFHDWREWICETTHTRPAQIARKIMESRDAEYRLETNGSDPDDTSSWQVFTVHRLDDSGGEDSTDNNQEFAYGSNTVDGCDCPALSAGHDPETNLFAVEDYDSAIRAQGVADTGTVAEETAKQTWLTLIDELKQILSGKYEADELTVATPRTLRETRLALKQAEKIAHDLGWVEVSNE